MASTAAVNNSPLISASDLVQRNQPSMNNRTSTSSRTHASSARDLAHRDEVQQREIATLSTHLRAASGEIPRALGVAVFSLVFAYAGQKTVLALMKNQKAKPTLVIAGGVGDATSGVAKEFVRAFLANYLPTLKVPNHVEGSRWPLTKQAGTTLVLSGVAEGLFNFLAGLSNSYGISKEMSYYGVDHIADKSEAYLKILNHINPNEIWSPLGVKAGSELVKDLIVVLGVALTFKLTHPEHDFQMCRKFNMKKVVNIALLNSVARVVVAVCSGAWINSNNNASQAAFMFTGARNASLPAVLHFIRVVSMGIMLAAFMNNRLSTGDSPSDQQNRLSIEDSPSDQQNRLSIEDSPSDQQNLRTDEIELHDVSNAPKQIRADDVAKMKGSDNPPPPQSLLTTNVAASSQAEDVTKSGATDTSTSSLPEKPETASSARAFSS